MIVVVVALAATVGKTNPGAALNDVGQITTAMAPFLGSNTAKILIGASILGGALVAALVVSLAGSWGLAEVLGWKHSLNDRINRRNAKFYVTYAAGPRGRRGAGPRQRGPGGAGSRLRGDERAAAADRPRVPARPGGQVPAAASTGCAGPTGSR